MLPCAPAAGPSGFADRVRTVAAPPSDSSGPVRDVARWGGRDFVQCETRTWWTSDAGRTWKHKDWFKDGPKGTVPALDKAGFTRASYGIWLGNRNGHLAWAFDTVSGGWVESPIGKGAAAAAGSGGRLYVLTGDRVLRTTRDAGVTWDPFPLPDSVRAGAFFDEILAEGEGVILRVRDPANNQRPAATLDGGRTWHWLPAHAPAALAHGCVYVFSEGRMAAICPGSVRRSDAPFASAQALFADPAGSVYAWADSALYASGPGSAQPWTVLASPSQLSGWERARDVLFCARGGTLSWFTGAAPAAGLRARRSGNGRGRPFENQVSWWMFHGRPYGVDGRGPAPLR